jgi:hypothetical protein
MAARIAYGYAYMLLAAGALCFVLSLILHSAVLMGLKAPFATYDVALCGAVVIVGILSSAFLKDGFMWMQQIKSCPKWMWRTALVLGFYTLLFGPFYAAASRSGPFWKHLAVSGVPIGFEAILFCILYSAIRSKYLNEAELAKGAGRSLLMTGFGLAMFLAHRAGYLPHR